MDERLSGAIDAFRKRAGHNVFWLLLVAAFAAALVVPLYLFEESGSVVVRQPVFKGELRPAPPSPPPPPTPQPPPQPPAQATAPAPAAVAPKPPPNRPIVLSDTRKPKLAPPPAAASAGPAAPLYQVQLGAFEVEQRAHPLAQRAAGEGFPAVVMHVTTTGGKEFHRVRLRDALPKAQAEALQANVKQKIPTLDPILVPGGR